MLSVGTNLQHPIAGFDPDAILQNSQQSQCYVLKDSHSYLHVGANVLGKCWVKYLISAKIKATLKAKTWYHQGLCEKISRCASSNPRKMVFYLASDQTLCHMQMASHRGGNPRYNPSWDLHQAPPLPQKHLGLV